MDSDRQCKPSTEKVEKCLCANYQRGLSEAWNGYGFCMLLGYGPPNLHVSSSALICRIPTQLNLKRAS
jgi:hypothetical protein